MARTELFARVQAGGVFTIENYEELAGGTAWFVNSATGTDSAGYGQNPDAPTATLDYAIGLAAAGDTIFIAQGHTETKAATGDLATVDVAGLRIIGLGNAERRPIFILDHAGATITVSAANVLLRNVIVESDVADCAVGLTASATADGLTVEDCVFRSGALTEELQCAISLAAACTRVTVRRCKFETAISAETGSETSAILAVGAADFLTVEDCTAIGNFGDAALDLDAAASVGIVLRRNFIHNIDSTNGLAISCHASTTGIVSDNRLIGLKTNTVPLACAGCSAFENYTSAAVNESGIVRPAAETYA